MRSAGELKAIAARDPRGEVATDGSKYLITFLSKKPSAADIKALDAAVVTPEVVCVEGCEAFAWSPNGVKAMKHSYSALGKRFGCVATARNWNTLEKVLAELRSSQAPQLGSRPVLHFKLKFGVRLRRVAR